MITFFRRFFNSKIGLAITIAFVGLIGFAFASMDVSGNATFGGVAGGDRVAIVGDAKIGTAELARSTTNALDQVRQENPTLSMQAFVQNEGLEQVLSRMIDRYAISEYATEYGLRAGENLVNSEILQIGAFRGADGNFDQATYQAALRQQGLTDATIRQDIGSSLLAQQIVSPAMVGVVMPEKVARRYASLLRESRKGSIGLIPSQAFAPSEDPTDAQLQTFYQSARSQFIRPERRTLRYVGFDAGIVEDRIAPTDAEIAARFERDAAQYAASETRRVTQLIVPTQQAADAMRERAQSGASLESLAGEAGFSTTSLGPVTKDELSESANEGVANSVFSAARGSIANPARSALGWHVIRVDNIATKAARTLAQVTPDIRQQLTDENRLRALADISAEIEDQIDSGASLNEVADTFDLDIQTTPELTADGRIYGQPNTGTPEALQPTLETAFQMEEGEPQLAEVVRGEQFIIFEVGEITPSATAPLNEIREQITVAWRLAEGNKKSREAADRIMERVAKGDTLASAIRQEETKLPPVESVNLNRQQLAVQGRQVPAPLALMFSMAEGTTKKLEGPNNVGWFIVDLDEVEVQPIENDDPLVAATKRNLREAMAGELADQLVATMRSELGVERNETAIDAVRKQLTGES